MSMYIVRKNGTYFPIQSLGIEVDGVQFYTDTKGNQFACSLTSDIEAIAMHEEALSALTGKSVETLIGEAADREWK